MEKRYKRIAIIHNDEQNVNIGASLFINDFSIEDTEFQEDEVIEIKWVEILRLENI